MTLNPDLHLAQRLTISRRNSDSLICRYGMHRDKFAFFQLIMCLSRCPYSTIAVVGRSGSICCVYSVPSLVVLPLSWIVRTVFPHLVYFQIFLFQTWPVLFTWNDLERHHNFKPKFALYNIQFHILWNSYRTYVVFWRSGDRASW